MKDHFIMLKKDKVTLGICKWMPDSPILSRVKLEKFGIFFKGGKNFASDVAF